LTLRVNQSLAKTAASVNYPSARPPRLIQIVAPFSSRLSRDIQALSWNSARMKAKGREEWQGVDGDWIETEALKLVDALRNAKLSTQLTKRPQVTAMALSMLADGFAEALVAEWTEPGDPEEFDPFDKRGDESF